MRRKTKSDLGIIESGVVLAFTATYCQRSENGKKCEGDKRMNCWKRPGRGGNAIEIQWCYGRKTPIFSEKKHTDSGVKVKGAC